jgi:translation elongation factor EF-G
VKAVFLSPSLAVDIRGSKLLSVIFGEGFGNKGIKHLLGTVTRHAEKPLEGATGETTMDLTIIC